MTVEHAADTLFALAANETFYLRLTDECGWTDDQYAQLLETLLAHIGTQTPNPRTASNRRRSPRRQD